MLHFGAERTWPVRARAPRTGSGALDEVLAQQPPLPPCTRAPLNSTYSFFLNILFIYLFIYLFICLFIYFWLCRVLVVACGLSCSVACGILVPWLGIEPASPALKGGFLTTGPPGKSLNIFFNIKIFLERGAPQLLFWGIPERADGGPELKL